MSVDDLIRQLDEQVATGAPFEAVLEAAARGTHQLDPRFDWTGIYELFPDDVLRLGPFVGSATDHVFIGVGTGVCGTAVAEKRNMNIADVRALSNYLACSTETRSELVILSLPEELPINETIELVRRCTEIGVASRTLIVNQVPTTPVDEHDRPLLAPFRFRQDELHAL